MNKMSNKYYYVAAIGGIFSSFIVTTSSILVGNTLNGAVVAIFLAFFIELIKSLLITYTANNFKNNSLSEATNILFGKIIGGSMNIFYSLLNLGFGFLLFRGLIELAKGYMIPSTSIILIAVFLLFIPLMAFFNDSRGFIRLLCYFTIVMIVWTLVEFLFGLQSMDFDYLKGIIVHSLKMPTMLVVASASFFHVGRSILFYFNPQFGKICYKKITLIHILGIPAGLMAITLPSGIWGPLAAANLEFPIVSTGDTLQIDLFFIERALYLLLPLFFLIAAFQMCTFMYTGIGMLREFYRPKKKIDLTIIIYFMLLIVMTYLTKDIAIFKMIGAILMVVYFLYTIALAIILSLGAKFKKVHKG